MSPELEKIAARFAEALEAGGNPQIEEYVKRSSEPSSELSRRLITLIVAHESKNNEKFPVFEDYLEKYSNYQAELEIIFGQKAPTILRFGIIAPFENTTLSVLYTATDRELDRVVMLKMPRITPDRDRAATCDRFRGEARIIAQLEHTNIIPVYGQGNLPSSGIPFFAMRLVEGSNFEKEAQNLHTRDACAPIKFQRLLRAFMSVCNAVSFAHEENVIHRDLKPQNLMIGKDGVPIVLDWGLAYLIDPASLSTDSETTIAIEGTPAYMSPEQAQGSPTARAKASDVFSLGSILYLILTGVNAFRSDLPGSPTAQDAEILEKVRNHEFVPPSKVKPDVDRRLERICKKAMSKTPKDRYKARELAQDVERWLADEPISVYQDTPIDLILRWSRKNRMAFGIATVGLFLLLLLFAVAAFMINQDRAKIELINFQSQFEKAQGLCESGDVAQGVALFGQALSNEGSSSSVLKSAIFRHAFERNIALWAPYVRTPDSALAHQGPVMATSAGGKNGNLVATGSRDGSVRIWGFQSNGQSLLYDYNHNEPIPSTESGTEKKDKKEYWVSAVACGWKSDIVVSCGWDGKVKLWEPSRKTELTLKALPGPSPPFNTLTLQSNDSLVAVGGRSVEKRSADGQSVQGRETSIYLWDLKNLDREPWVIPIRDQDKKETAITALAFHPVAPILAVADIDGGIELVDVSQELAGLKTPINRNRKILRKENGAAVYGLSFSPSTGALAACGDDGVLSIWPVREKWQKGINWENLFESASTERHPSHLSLSALAFHPKADLFATAGADQFVYFWEYRSPQLRRVGTPIRMADPTLSLAFSPDGKTLWTGGRDNIARRWNSPGENAENRKPPDSITGAASLAKSPRVKEDKQQVPAIVFGKNEDRLTLLAAGWDTSARFWQGNFDKSPLDLNIGMEKDEKVLDVDINQSNSRQILIVNPGMVRIMKLDQNLPVQQLVLLHPEVRAAAFDRSGNYVVSVSNDASGLIRIWKLTNPEPDRYIFGRFYGNPINAVAFEPTIRADRLRFVIGSSDQQAVMFDAKSADFNRNNGVVMARHEGSVNSVGFSHDGAWLLTASADRSAARWNVAEPNPDLAIARVYHQSYVNGIAIAPDDRTLLTCSDDGTAQLWDVETCKPLGPSLRHGNDRAIRAVAFAPDGELFVTSDLDGEVKLWTLPKPERAPDFDAFAKALTGLQIQNDRLRKIEPDQWLKLRNKIQPTLPPRLKQLLWPGSEPGDSGVTDIVGH